MLRTPGPATSRPARRWAATLAAGSLLLVGGCVGADQQADAPSPDAGTQEGGTGIPEGLEEFYGQDVAWEDCAPSGATCGTVTVPLDYSDPGGEMIELHVKRSAEPDGGGQGPLFVNPGGPGGEAASMVDAAAYFFTPELTETYQIVAVDPRGVGQSNPVDCVSDPELDTILAATYDLDTPEGVDGYLAETERIAQQCAENAGVDLLAHVSTEEAARDMDVVRAVLGSESLDYLGFSYGTFLGAMYAHLFPANVGRMVLDGGLDPTLSTHEVVLGQATGFEGSLRAWAQDCIDGGGNCPFTGTADDAVAEILAFLESVEESPLPSESGRSVTASLASMGIITPLYSEESWPYLTQALAQALGGDGTQLLSFADLGSGRQADGTYASNSTEALWAINCRDFPATTDRAQWDADAQELEEAAPVVGPALGYSDALCAAWPQEAQPEAAIEGLSAEGSAPILVVGTTGDPATPYAWSESLAAQLGDHATLLTVEGFGHTAYNSFAGACVTDAVEGYLIGGEMPQEGTRC